MKTLSIIFLLLILSSPAWAQTDPSGLELITAENAARLEPIGILGWGRIGNVAWSPDGDTLAVSSQRGIWLYDLQDLSQPVRQLAPEEGASLIGYTPDGRRLVYATGAWQNGAAVHVWDTASEQDVRTFSLPPAWYPQTFGVENGLLIIQLVDEELVRLISLESGNQNAAIRYTDLVLDFEFSSDKRFVALRGMDGLSVWNVQTGERPAESFEETGCLFRRLIQCTRDGSYYVRFYPGVASPPRTNGNPFLRIDRVGSNEVIEFQITDATHHDGNILGFSPDDSVLITQGTTGEPREVPVEAWDAMTGELLSALSNDVSRLEAIFLDDQRVVLHDNRIIKVWDYGTGALLYERNDLRRILAFSPSGTQAFVQISASTVEYGVLDLLTDEMLQSINIELHFIQLNDAFGELPSEDVTVGAFDVNLDTETVRYAEGITVSEEFGEVYTAVIRKQPENTVIRRIPLDQEYRDVVLNADATRLAATTIIFPEQIAVITLWNAVTGEYIADLSTQDRPYSVAEFTPEGDRLIAASQDGKIRIWDAVTGTQENVIYLQAGSYATALTLSGDGQRLYTSSVLNRTTEWDVTSALGRLLRDEGMERLDDLHIRNMDITADDSALIQHQPFFWQVRIVDMRGAVVFTFPDRTTGFDLSEDGIVIAVYRNDGPTQLWGVPSD